MNGQTGAVRSSFDQALVANQFIYSEPPGLIGRKVSAFGVEILDSAGELYASLKDIEEDEARRRFNAFVSPGGQLAATHWWFGAPGRIGIGWPHNLGGTLRVNYPGGIEPVEADSAIFDGAAILCSVTKGSTAVTFNDDIPEGIFGEQDGDVLKWEIGIGTEASPPSTWYRLSSVTVAGGLITGATLSRAYRGTTNATASFLVSRVSDLCMAMGGAKVGMLAVYYFLSEISSEQDKVHPQEWGRRFLAAIPAAIDIPSGARQGGTNASQYGLVVR